MIDPAGFITYTYVANCGMQYQSESVTMSEKYHLYPEVLGVLVS